jgi:hypothetical protein
MVTEFTDEIAHLKRENVVYKIQINDLQSLVGGSMWPSANISFKVQFDAR